ncbi:hypothetical protein [Paracoccus ravus]|uniref:hypothetical protein n=1 Tax=Paracoccus ravus TaxID=2447760 RepID=UPI00106E4873|nr:hypothetical protein [Paracoccus ravus]
MVEYYASLMQKFAETPEFKDYLKATSQTRRIPRGGRTHGLYQHLGIHAMKVFEAEGWNLTN